MTKRVIELIKLTLGELEEKILKLQEECIMLLKPYVNKQPLVIPEKIMIIYREFVGDYLNFSYAYMHKKISAIEKDTFALKISAKNSMGENHYAALYDKKEFIKQLNAANNNLTSSMSNMQGANPRINQLLFGASAVYIPYAKERDNFAVDIYINKRRNTRPTHGDNSITNSYRMRFQEVESPKKQYSCNIMLINRALENHAQVGAHSYSIGTIMCPVTGFEILTVEQFDAYCQKMMNVD